MEKQLSDNVSMADPLDRVDGKLKVTGTATYSAEYQIPNLAYGVLVSSTIARGTIKSIDTKPAERAPGVLGVITHLNSLKIPGYETGGKPSKGRTTGQALRIFNSDIIYFNGQPIAIVVAQTLERALYAASLVKATYTEEKHQTDLMVNTGRAMMPKGSVDYKRGEANAYLSAPVNIERQYMMPIEVHNPMELHSTVAIWEGDDQVKVYDKTQGVKSTQRTIMDAFKLPEKNVQVITRFVGGGFGSALRTWPHVIAAVLAAKMLKTPVKLVLSRDQMFTMVGYRPRCFQKIGIGATADGKITGITHEATSITSFYEDFTERSVNMTKFMYASPNVNTVYRIVPLDLSTPTWMRGPGEATGAYALESAMDEMAYALKLDPVDFRLRNYAEIDQERNLPWSSKYLKECYQVGADRIGWNKRDPRPASMREGEMLVGYGMGSGVFNASRNRAVVLARIRDDGSLILQSAVSDSGSGTATSMIQIASQVMGIAPAKIIFELGDSSFPMGPSQGGSTTTSTLGSAVHDACVALQQKLIELASRAEGSVFKDASPESIIFKDGAISLSSKPEVKALYTAILKQQSLTELEVTEESKSGEERQKYSMYSFSAHFAQVFVHPATGVVKVNKVVSVTDAGRIVSEKTARSQAIGGVVGGIGMALMEEAVIDHRYGRLVNNNLADYHVPVHADVPHIEALFINKKDPYINPMGSKGLGEISLVGIAAAIANAVFHATGKRVRDLPITPDKLL
ncbi:MAG: xanthine dehydrogenase family protein molybdopterin-binding subunit [Chitinophagaceae bacterium]